MIKEITWPRNKMKSVQDNDSWFFNQSQQLLPSIWGWFMVALVWMGKNDSNSVIGLFLVKERKRREEEWREEKRKEKKRKEKNGRKWKKI